MESPLGQPACGRAGSWGQGSGRPLPPHQLPSGFLVCFFLFVLFWGFCFFVLFWFWGFFFFFWFFVFVFFFLFVCFCFVLFHFVGGFFFWWFCFVFLFLFFNFHSYHGFLNSPWTWFLPPWFSSHFPASSSRGGSRSRQSRALPAHFPSSRDVAVTPDGREWDETRKPPPPLQV